MVNGIAYVPIDAWWSTAPKHRNSALPRFRPGVGEAEGSPDGTRRWNGSELGDGGEGQHRAMKALYEHLGYGEYKPVLRPDGSPYPEDGDNDFAERPE